MPSRWQFNIEYAWNLTHMSCPTAIIRSNSEDMVNRRCAGEREHDNGGRKIKSR